MLTVKRTLKELVNRPLVRTICRRAHIGFIVYSF